MNDTTMTIRLPAELLAQLESRAKELDRSLAWVVRTALRQYLERGYVPDGGINVGG